MTCVGANTRVQQICLPGLDPGQGFLFDPRVTMWVYIMANRYRVGMYVGVTSNLPARVAAHLAGRGSEHVAEKGLSRLVWAEQTEDSLDAIAHEKRLKRWRREWKFALIERGNPEWHDLSGLVHGKEG